MAEWADETFSPFRNNSKSIFQYHIMQEELAARIVVTGKTINTIETGKFAPSTIFILAIKLARFFEIKVEELFTLVEK